MRLPSSNLSDAIAESRTYTPCAGSPEPSIPPSRWAPAPSARLTLAMAAKSIHPPVLVRLTPLHAMETPRCSRAVATGPNPMLLYHAARQGPELGPFSKVFDPDRGQTLHLFRRYPPLVRPDRQLQC